MTGVEADPGGETRSSLGKPSRSKPEFLYLTTTGRRTGLPREIEIWFTRRAGRAYLVAETGERAHWVRNLRADPRVRWRIGSRRDTGWARVVDPARETALAAAVRARFERKYGWGDGLVVELRPRQRQRGPAVDTGAARTHRRAGRTRA